MKKIASICVLLTFSLIVLTSCANPTPKYLIGLVSLDLYGGDVKKASSEMHDYILQFESKVAVDLEGSDIKKINDSAVFQKISVSDVTSDMLNYAFDMYEKTSGAFNIASFPATRLWKFSAFDDIYDVKRQPPLKQEIESILPILDFQECFEIGDRYVIKKKQGAMLDLGGIAKGYLADKCLEIAKKHGITNGKIDISSNLVLIGKHIENRKYRIGITPPRNEIEYISVLSLEDTAVATSGDYERYFMHDGQRYCHIIDSKTASPIQNGIMSVTIINDSSMLCDVYSTTGFVLGVEKAIEFYNENGIDSIILFERDGKKYFAVTGDIEYSNLYGEYSIWTS